MTSKIYIFDTNVILHDYNSIFVFEENDLILPMCVLEELDHFKKGDLTINYNCRRFFDILDSMCSSSRSIPSGQGDFGETEGDMRFISLGEGMGRLFFDTHTYPDSLYLEKRSVDNGLLNLLHHYEFNRGNHSEAILVTKDVNLRIKAKVLGLKAQDYSNDSIEGSVADKGIETVKVDCDEMSLKIDQFYADREVSRSFFEEFVEVDGLKDNSFFVFKGPNNKSALAKYRKDIFSLVSSKDLYGVCPKNSEQNFLCDALMDPEIKLVTVTGKAGTGKTLLSLAAAIEQRKNYHQIYLARPIVPLSNKDIGFLPGDIDAKIGPYMQPLYDNLNFLKSLKHKTSNTVVDNMLEQKKIEVAPLAYIRGRSLNNIFFIIDEAQNLTQHEMKTIVTRIGMNSKIVFTGDIFQIDHPYLGKKSNGLSYLIQKMLGQSFYAHVNLEKGMRSELAEVASNLL